MSVQGAREISIKTPLEEDKLLLRRMVASEHLGRPYTFELELLSADGAIDPDAILGEAVTVRLAVGDDGERFFSGIATRFAMVGTVGNYFAYQATLRPWFWLLTRATDCRIYKGTVFDIIKDAFSKFDFVDYDDADCDKSKSPARDFCVQYRETYFDFVSRLLEQDGIYYWFEHGDGKVTMKLADAAKCHSPGPGCDDVPYYPPSEGDIGVGECISAWSFSREIQPGKYSLEDFDFERPTEDLAVDVAASRKHKQASLEVYDYPGEYIDASGPGKHYVGTRLEELQCQHGRVRGACDVRGLHVGGLFTLSAHPRDDQNKEYLVVSAVHELRSNEFESGGVAADTNYQAHFEAMLSSEPFRAPRVTPLPVVRGPQTAIVVGPDNEEIWTDKYGRVKVQFHWDRLGKMNDESSWWIRVAQVWAGATWGGIHIPRIGQEVIVEFLEGDPDKPIITGCVYNADQMPPYELPKNQTQSGVKSRSSKGAGDANFNEIRFEDMKGSEELYIHAEKNHTNITENDRSEDVGNDRSLHVGHDKSEKIDNNKTIKVAVDHTEDIGANKTLTVGANHSEKIGANMDINVSSNLSENVGMNYAENVAIAMAINVGAAMAIDVGAAMSTNVGAVNSLVVGASNTKTVGGDDTESVSGKKQVTVAKDLEETIDGAHKETVTKDFTFKAKTITIEAEDEIIIKTGDASIGMKKDGTFTINGKDLELKGSGKIQLKADSDLTLKGSKIAEN